MSNYVNGNQTKICSYCGCRLENNKSFCGMCGSPVNVNNGFYSGPYMPDGQAYGYALNPENQTNKKFVTLIVLPVITVCALSGYIAVSAMASTDGDSGSSVSSSESFEIEGKWKNTGDTTFAEVLEGSIITFDGNYCSIYGPGDSYAFYEQNGEHYLDCTGCLSGDTIHFTVNIINNDEMELVLSDSLTLSLTRIG